MKKKISILLFAIALVQFGLSSSDITPKASTTYSNFVENKGQIFDQYGNPNHSIEYLGMFADFNVQVKETGWSYDIYRNIEKITEYHRLDFNFVNSSSSVVIKPIGKAISANNYYGFSHKTEIVGVNEYNGISYKNVWDGVDLDFVTENGRPKYNVIISEPKSIEKIKIEINGSRVVELRNGALYIKTKFGDFIEEIPFSFITTEQGQQREVEVEYKLEGHTLSFSAPSFSINEQLTIDPVPQQIWGIRFGNSTNDYSQPEEFVVGNNGKSYCVGTTREKSGIATSGSHFSIITNSRSVTVGFIICVDSNGNKVWGTYYGNSTVLSATNVLDIAMIGDSNLAVVGGSSQTSGIASSGAFQATKNAVGYDGFIALFDTNGVRKWGTYFGGNKYDDISAVATDKSGNIYVAGNTSSTDTIATNGAHKLSQPDSSDAFLAKFGQSGQRIWCTLYGGSHEENGRDLAIDHANNLYLVGKTNSKTGISSTGSHKASLSGTKFDAYLAKFDSSGALLKGTYYGGNDDDNAETIAIGGNGDVVFGGATLSNSGIATIGAYHFTGAGNSWQENGFLVNFDSSGTQKWGTYIRKTNNNSRTVADISVGDSAKILIVTSNLVGNGTHILGFDSSGTNFINESATHTSWPSIHFLDNNSYLILGGYFITSFGGVKASLSKYLICPNSFSSLSVPAKYCEGDSVQINVTGGSKAYWFGPNGFRDTAISVVIPDIQILNGGSYVVHAINSIGCLEPHVFTVRVDTVSAYLSDTSVFCKGDSLILSSSTSMSRTWYLPDNSSDTNQAYRISSIKVSDSGTYALAVTDTNGCKDSLTTVINVVDVNAKIDTIPPVCNGDQGTFRASPKNAKSYSWFLPNGNKFSSDSVEIQTLPLSAAGIFKLVVEDFNGCIDSAFRNVSVVPKPSANGSSGSTPCVGGIIRLFSSGGTSYSWTGPSGFQSTLQNPTISNAHWSTNSGNYEVVVTNQYGCNDKKIVNVRVNDNPVLNITNNSPICEGEDLRMSVTGAGTYLWTPPAGASFTLQSWRLSNSSRNDAGSYTVVGTDANGCRSTKNALAVINYVDPIANSNSPIKVGENLILSGSGGTVYDWSGPANGFFGASQTIPTSDKRHAGVWTLTVHKNSCKNDTTLVVVIEDEEIKNPNPNVSIELLDGKSYLKVYPTPSSGTVFVEIQSNEEQKMYLGKVFNVTGQAVFNLPLEFRTNGVNEFHLNVSGTYQLQVLDENGKIQATKRIIIAN